MKCASGLKLVHNFDLHSVFPYLDISAIVYFSVWYTSHGLSFFSVLLNKEVDLNLWIEFLIVIDILLTFEVFIIKLFVQSDFGNVLFGSEVLSLDEGLWIIQQ